MLTALDLHTLTVLVTRPDGETLSQQLRQANACALSLPMLAIGPPPDIDPDALRQQIQHALQTHPLVIFVSPSAVHETLRYCELEQLRACAHLAVMGSGSAAALAHYGLQADIQPQTQISADGLLEHPLLENLMQTPVVLFSGSHGRTDIASTLMQRGAQVEAITTYAATKPGYTAHDVSRTLLHPDLTIMIVTSALALTHLVDYIHAYAPQRMHTPLCVSSARLHHIAKAHGFTQIVQCDNATDEGILIGLQRWVDQRTKHGNE